VSAVSPTVSYKHSHYAQIILQLMIIYSIQATISSEHAGVSSSPQLCKTSKIHSRVHWLTFANLFLLSSGSEGALKDHLATTRNCYSRALN